MRTPGGSPVDDLHGAHAVAGDHDPAHRFCPTFDEGGRPEGIADLHVGDLRNEDRDTVVPADHHLFEILGALDEAQPADHGPGTAAFHHIAADIAIAAQDRVHDGGDGDPEGAQALGIDVDRYCRTTPPTLATSATPGTALS